jgi:hypothetical protein
MSTPPLRILIVDDEPSRSKDWATKIESLGLTNPTANISALDIAAARTLIEHAGTRRKNAREINQSPFSGTVPCDLDNVDVLVVDYDLQELLQTGHWSTGLQIAALARAFTKVKLIVLVNQFGTNTFDLTLIKALHSHADLDVGSDQLLNPAFWDRSKSENYSPWIWNDGVLKAPMRIEAMVQWMVSRLDSPVLSSLGFTTDSDSSTTGTFLAKDLWQECLNAPSNTFRQMVTESEFLTPKDREAIASFDEPCARVAAALVCHWLDRWVIPANEVLMDLPHLAGAYPWLLIKKEDPTCWQSTASLENGFDALLTGVKKHEFAPGFPLSRPVVWRQKVIQDAELAEPTGFTYDGFPDLVFCEDTSKFVEFTHARPFSCRLPSGDTQRFVADHRKEKQGRTAHSLDGVLYEPSVFFTL